MSGQLLDVDGVGWSPSETTRPDALRRGRLVVAEAGFVTGG
jgi:hypothetical protein